MASVRTEISITAPVEAVWDVVRDFGSGPRRMAPGYVTDSRRADAQTRLVTFANGTVARERLVAVDDEQRRVVYAIVGDTLRPDHDNAAMQVLPDGEGRCRFVWIHDVLPDDLAAPLHAAMQEASVVIKRTLETQAETQAAR